MKTAAALILTLSLAACSTDIPVTMIGPETYLVGKQGYVATESVTKLEADAFQDAGAYCAMLGRQIEPVSTQNTPGVLGRSFPESQVQFRCLLPGDPELRRPNFRLGANVVIENRQGN